MFFHKSIAILSNLLYLLYAGFPTMLDSFLLHSYSQYHLHSYRVGGWGQAGSYKVAGKGYIFTKNKEMAFIGAIFTSLCHTKQLNLWPNPSASCVVIYIQSAVCLPREDEAIYRPSKHSWMPDRLERKA